MANSERSKFTSFTIKPLTANEAIFLPEMLYLAVYVPEGIPPPPKEIVFEPGLVKYIQGWGREGDLGFIAVEDGSGLPLGAAWLRLLLGENKGYGYLDDATPELTIAVKEGYRGQGLGSQLLQKLLEESPKLYSSISLSVSIGNSAANLYRRFGFTPVGQDHNAITMRKKLI